MKKMRFIFVFSISLCICALFANSREEEKLLQIVEFLYPEESGSFTVEPLSGCMTNTAYKISGPDFYFAKFCIDRENLLGSSLDREYETLRLIANTGISPKPLYYDSKEGVLITEFIQGKGEQLDLRQEKNLSHVCDSLRELHSFDVKLTNFYCPFKELEALASNAKKANAKIPSFLMEEILQRVKVWKAATSLFALEAPCHLDLHSKNIIEGRDRLWLIDWEFAGQSDPWYDLAVMASAESFTDSEMEELLKIYQGSDSVSEQLKDHFLKMRVLADARWAIWSYIQKEISPMNHSFEQQGDQYFQACKERFLAIEKDSF